MEPLTTWQVMPVMIAAIIAMVLAVHITMYKFNV